VRVCSDDLATRDLGTEALAGPIGG
jgi:hypothetical protein